MAKPLKIYECHEGDVVYRVRPNPECHPSDGYAGGAVIQWREHDKTEWSDDYHIGPEALEAISVALMEASRDVKND